LGACFLLLMVANLRVGDKSMLDVILEKPVSAHGLREAVNLLLR